METWDVIPILKREKLFQQNLGQTEFQVRVSTMPHFNLKWNDTQNYTLWDPGTHTGCMTYVSEYPIPPVQGRKRASRVCLVNIILTYYKDNDAREDQRRTV